jgi:uncharacterized membrane protein YebE (DUF533 family)
MPIATQDTLVALEYTESILPVSSTIPVLSKTPFAKICASYSKNSVLAGAVGGAVDAVVTAKRTETVEADLLQKLTVATVNVLAGTVYNSWYVVADMSSAPILPVAI